MFQGCVHGCLRGGYVTAHLHKQHEHKNTAALVQHDPAQIYCGDLSDCNGRSVGTRMPQMVRGFR